MMTLAGLAGFGILALATFVAPNWADYRFYNWQMSVTRKPSYDMRSLLNRVTWFPIVHDIFTRMWFTVVVGLLGLAGVAARWRTVSAGERLLAWWMTLGALELILHDVGNERRFVFFIPALVALTAIVLGRDRRLLPEAVLQLPRIARVIAAPVVLYAAYVVCGALLRLAYLYEPGPGVRLSAAAALGVTALLFATWPRLPRFLVGAPMRTSSVLLLAGLVTAGQVAQFGQWARGRTYKNYLASVELGTVLPPGTLVHGKLANGLSLENRIRPVFVGTNFGNYADRKQRDDVRYILTYIVPRIGYEGSVIRDVLDAYPQRTIIKTFDVAESTGGRDRAALIDKFGGASPGNPRAPGQDQRAHD